MRVRCDGREGPVWRIGLAPDADGQVALDVPRLAELQALLVEASAEGSPCRALVITSAADGVFCRGMDLQKVIDAPAEERQAGVDAYVQTLLALRRARPAVICVVDGEAMGGGVGLAAASDLVVATQRASFGLPEVVLGLMPAMVLPFLCERLAPQKARWLAMSGGSLDAARAHGLGLVDEVCEDAAAAERACRRALKRLLRAEPRAVGNVRAFTASLPGMTLEEAAKAGGGRTTADLERASTRDAVRAFLGGELPPWFDRLPASPAASGQSEQREETP